MAQRKSTSRVVFHFIYNTVYVLLCLLLAALVLITPGDVIRQAYIQTFQYSNIIIIAIAYCVTVLIVLFIYSLRLYVRRTVLASIPKASIPIGKGDVKKPVYDMIKKELSRSAAIAWEARPKVSGLSLSAAVPVLGGEYLGGEEEDVREPGSFEAAAEDEKQHRHGIPAHWPRLKKAATVESEMGIALPPTQPVWGEIEHPGWGSPNSPDLANVQYSAVLAELPNLIEGKAISLAPPDLELPEDPSALDPEAVALLQRIPNMSMRSYVGRLVDLGVIRPSKDVADFLDVYERARYSTRPMPVHMFRRLMHLFAQLLRSTQPLDPAVIDTMHDMDDMYTDSEGNMDIDDDAPQNTCPTTPARSLRSMESNTSSSSGQSRRLPSQRPGLLARNSSGNTWAQYGTAPTTPKSKGGRSSRVSRPDEQRLRAGSVKTHSSGSSSSAVDNFAQTRRPYVGTSSISSGKSKSNGSLGSAASNRSGSDGSVIIRLSKREDGSSLPYVLRMGES
ncbi:hypothetical protein BX600DRAFT_451959 [Xylariales sp. PMI_506]|nr:hypothetical protein BX600DRAFT_451959 [Xylariales sp. PMI_506]